MSIADVADPSVLDAVLDSWNRNNTILVNLLHLIPQDGFKLRAVEDSPSIAELFNHIHYVRLVFVAEDAPELSGPLPDEEWARETRVDVSSHALNQSADAVGRAVRDRVDAWQGMDTHYDHPILMLQHMIWHEGYHHGQIKLLLKVAGCPIPDKQAGPLTWRIWMDKTSRGKRLG